MPYGTIKVDNITFTDNSVDKTVSLSGLIQNPTFTGNVTVTGTISGDVIRGGTTISGVTVTGTTANFVSGVFTTQVSGATIVATTGTFASLTGTTTTITSGVFSAGSATAPSVAVGTGTTYKPGIYSPGTDQLAISTNGTGRLFVDASGNVGLGLSNPSYPLEVASSADSTINITGGTSNLSRLFFSDTTLARGFLNYDHASDSLRIGTAGSEQMRLTSAGLLGLGTSSPSYPVVIFRRAGSTITEPLLNLQSQNSGVDGDSFILFGTQTANWSAGVDQADSNKFRIEPTTTLGAATGLTITTAGNLGIGTTSPGNLLHVSGTGTVCQLASSNNNNLINLKGNGATNGVWLGTTSSDDFVISSGALVTERARIDSSGRLLVGTSTSLNSADFQISVGSGASSAPYAAIFNTAASPTSAASTRLDLGFLSGASNYVATNTVLGGINFMGQANDNGYGGAGISAIVTSGGNVGRTAGHSIALTFSTKKSSVAGYEEGMRLDASGRLLVGTSSVINNNYGGTSGRFQVAKDDFLPIGFFTFNSTVADGYCAYLELNRARGTQASPSVVGSGDDLGLINFYGHDGTTFIRAATIRTQVDGTPGTNDMPGRLVFSTTLDGASSPTERMRITSAGAVLITKTVRDFTTEGIVLAQGSSPGTDTSFVTNGGTAATFSRSTNDGTIISLRQDGTEEGTISVSGTTISYNGAHLSRWSQLPGGATREEILRGTVLSNLDEMCGWGEEENEQLNRMKVSDVEGDKNVSGVFQAWDDDDDTYTDDFYCAMTGDFIIRIAEGVTVERGDLLMSAGDGTAKPQADDIIRSKTIAKVTSTHVTCTYENGSYCIPCVLMAC